MISSSSAQFTSSSPRHATLTIVFLNHVFMCLFYFLRSTKTSRHPEACSPLTHPVRQLTPVCAAFHPSRQRQETKRTPTPMPNDMQTRKSLTPALIIRPAPQPSSLLELRAWNWLSASGEYESLAQEITNTEWPFYVRFRMLGQSSIVDAFGVRVPR
jgi:hypothetical protein